MFRANRPHHSFRFLPHFHYNKDWNKIASLIILVNIYFLPHFHYNKDWNIVWHIMI